MMNPKHIPKIFLLFLIVLVACTPTVPVVTLDTQKNVQNDLTDQPESINFPVIKPALSRESVSITVMAAASLTESFTELGQAFETQYPWVKLSFNFAGSQTLADQLTHGAPADVFASANMKYMTAMIDAGIINSEDSRIFAGNRLVVIYPVDNPANLNDLVDLARPGVKIILADESVPVGTYSINFLDKASMAEGFGISFKDNVLRNVVSYENNVKSVLAKVALNEADAGIVYFSDISVDAGRKVGTIDIPNDFNTIATYPIAPVAASKNLETANLFINFVLSAQGQKILEGFNFVTPTQ